MKLLAILLFVALVGKISATPQPRYLYRMAEESSETEDPQSDETEVEEIEGDDLEAPQDDDVSEEDDPPPAFHKLFPTPQNKPGQQNHGPTNFAFQNMLKEIDENGWKQPKHKRNPGQQRQRSAFLEKPVYYRNDDDDSEEDEEDDDAEDDEPFGAPDFDKMFPNPEGKPSGPTNLPENAGPLGPVSELGGPASASTSGPGGVDGLRYRSSIPFGRSPVYQGRSQRPQVYYGRQMPQQSVRYVQKPTYTRAPVQSYPVSYRQVPSYNRRVSSYQMPVSYRQVQQPYAYAHGNRVQYQYQPTMSMGYRQRQQTGPVYVDNYGRQQQQQYYGYNSSPVRRTYVPMVYARQPSYQQYGQGGMRMRRNYNGRYWKSH